GGGATAGHGADTRGAGGHRGAVAAARRSAPAPGPDRLRPGSGDGGAAGGPGGDATAGGGADARGAGGHRGAVAAARRSTPAPRPDRLRAGSGGSVAA